MGAYAHFSTIQRTDQYFRYTHYWSITYRYMIKYVEVTVTVKVKWFTGYNSQCVFRESNLFLSKSV